MSKKKEKSHTLIKGMAMIEVSYKSSQTKLQNQIVYM
jgi:hypothetical protein